MSDVLLARIARHADNRRTQIDMGDLSIPTIAPALTEAQLAESQATLGFTIPELLTHMYRGIGNGGFGPGYGLIGLVGGTPDDQGKNAVELYQIYSSSDPNDPSWKWPRGLLPICHWGCAIYSCVDCEAGRDSIVVFDPNLHDDSWVQCFRSVGHNLESWLSAWVGGTKLWDEMYGEQET